VPQTLDIRLHVVSYPVKTAVDSKGNRMHQLGRSYVWYNLAYIIFCVTVKLFSLSFVRAPSHQIPWRRRWFSIYAFFVVETYSLLHDNDEDLESDSTEQEEEQGTPEEEDEQDDEDDDDDDDDYDDDDDENRQDESKIRGDEETESAASPVSPASGTAGITFSSNAANAVILPKCHVFAKMP